MSQLISKSVGILFFTNERFDDWKVQEYIGLVHGCSIQGINMIKDFRASLSDKFGGSVDSYESSMDKAVGLALRKMAIQAKEQGANAIIKVDLDFSDVNNRMLMCNAHGTAVRLVRK